MRSGFQVDLIPIVPFHPHFPHGSRSAPSFQGVGLRDQPAAEIEKQLGRPPLCIQRVGPGLGFWVRGSVFLVSVLKAVR